MIPKQLAIGVAAPTNETEISDRTDVTGSQSEARPAWLGSARRLMGSVLVLFILDLARPRSFRMPDRA